METFLKNGYPTILVEEKPEYVLITTFMKKFQPPMDTSTNTFST
ncbi:hypothetical protein [Escherichia phage phiWec189]|uniref:Uncharacterized protein n=1 Tax=Escherichia phage phiWec189 TaxID=2992785 RepID=A0ACA8S9M4_9CAUD|nr:hypothetical protein [Escherichia phage phiWec189]